MPLILKNDAALHPTTGETVEAAGVTLPVYPYLGAAEKMQLSQISSQFGGETTDPLFILHAFAIFTRWRAAPEYRGVTFDDLASSPLTSEELSDIARAVSRLFAATKENAAEGGEEGKPEKKVRS